MSAESPVPQNSESIRSDLPQAELSEPFSHGQQATSPHVQGELRTLIAATQTEINAIRKASLHPDRMIEERDHLISLIGSLRLEVGRLEEVHAVRVAGRRQVSMVKGAGLGVIGIVFGMGLSRLATRRRHLSWR